jgi:hypothetical protein
MAQSPRDNQAYHSKKPKKEGWVFEMPRKKEDVEWIFPFLQWANAIGLENKEIGLIRFENNLLIVEAKPETTKDFLARMEKE